MLNSWHSHFFNRAIKSPFQLIHRPAAARSATVLLLQLLLADVGLKSRNIGTATVVSLVQTSFIWTFVKDLYPGITLTWAGAWGTEHNIHSCNPEGVKSHLNPRRQSDSGCRRPSGDLFNASQLKGQSGFTQLLLNLAFILFLYLIN